VYVGEWRPVIRGVAHQIVGVFFACRMQGEQVTLSSEHDAFRWVWPKDLAEVDVMDPQPEAIAAWLRR
jgi:8-oxo-dGTP pyrophosphatase MutT (NUDIX family)